MSDKCRHVFYFKKNDCWYCDMSMMPVDEDCKMACFTNNNSEQDNATNLMNEFQGLGIEREEHDDGSNRG